MAQINEKWAEMLQIHNASYPCQKQILCLEMGGQIRFSFIAENNTPKYSKNPTR